MGAAVKTLITLLFTLLALPGWAGENGHQVMDMTGSALGLFALVLFVGAYTLVIMEEKLHLRKSKPVLLAAGIIWVLVAIAFKKAGQSEAAHHAVMHNLVEYAELLLFLLAAMTYINAMEERNVFQALRSWLVSRGFSLRVIFWLTGLLAFLISPVADNLTTALLMGAVVMAVGGANQRFVVVACINVVVGANAGGAFSPFGDITTLMVWQKGVVEFSEFFALFLPSLANWLVPALIMNFFISKEKPQALDESVRMKFGAKRIIFLFLCTIVTAVSFHNFLHLPPATGMMLGLGYLGIFSYYIKKKDHARIMADEPMDMTSEEPHSGFDLFRKIARAEWDTLLFFYGVILCVGGLGQFGYLALASHAMYAGLGPLTANVLVGVLSAIVDNIPVMFAVLTMEPHMSHGHWLLVTLTAGVGGSLLSIGSAAGVALMGSARGIYTFGRHLVFTPAIALGYAASIVVHLLVNGRLFH
ncbi:sodium:proton antiporter NhaD [Desulfuromonas thiophila]|uniref:Sodium/proton antiporter, NhaD family n=1 Tax=Desulfuromonas thiophila TaxID=57664 RepID=A0A1G7F6W6_9BACT|nr:sodium/proton antiporter, NhaD family [Desulfuromonas thiophila]